MLGSLTAAVLGGSIPGTHYTQDVRLSGCSWEKCCKIHRWGENPLLTALSSKLNKQTNKNLDIFFQRNILYVGLLKLYLKASNPPSIKHSFR